MQKDEFIGDKVKFWVKGERSEIDVLLEFDHLIIGIEVKYHSPLSSDDQLEREASDLLKGKGQTPKFLLLLGTEPEVNMIAKKVMEDRKLPSGVHFGYLSWQEVFHQLVYVQKNETFNHVCIIVLAMEMSMPRFGFLELKKVGQKYGDTVRKRLNKV
ncbi:hypothetical protein [Ureibacillus sp. FSL K6-3587]